MGEISKYEISNLQELILLELVFHGPMRGSWIVDQVEEANRKHHLLQRVNESSVYKSIDGLFRRGLIYETLSQDHRNRSGIYWAISDEGRQVLRHQYQQAARFMDWRIRHLAAIWD